MMLIQTKQFLTVAANPHSNLVSENSIMFLKQHTDKTMKKNKNNTVSVMTNLCPKLEKHDPSCN